MLPGQTKLFSPRHHAQRRADHLRRRQARSYTPHNYKGEYYGEITARYALMRSDNNATISLAAMVGFDRVAALGRDAGIVNAPGHAIGGHRLL